MNSTDYQEYLEPCIRIAKAANDIIQQYPTSKYGFEEKTDASGHSSKVTLADQMAGKYIVEALQKLTPGIPVICEEDDVTKIAARKDVGKGDFWLVDPLDGTSGFIKGSNEYTVNIALIRNHQPVLGVIYSPSSEEKPEAGIKAKPEELYYGTQTGGAFRVLNSGAPEKIAIRKNPEGGLVVIQSRTTQNEKSEHFINELPVKEKMSSSSSIKFCKLAEGSADIYPRFGRTMEWDTAAGHAILNAAGGHVIDMEGNELTYGKSGGDNPNFIAYGAPYKFRERGWQSVSFP